jgi:hypothetical protein
MTSDEARAWAGIMRVAKGMDDLERSTKKVTDASKDLKREQEAMGRDAAKIWEQTRTPLEQYEEAMIPALRW